MGQGQKIHLKCIHCEMEMYVTPEEVAQGDGFLECDACAHPTYSVDGDKAVFYCRYGVELIQPLGTLHRGFEADIRRNGNLVGWYDADEKMIVSADGNFVIHASDLEWYEVIESMIKFGERGTDLEKCA